MKKVCLLLPTIFLITLSLQAQKAKEKLMKQLDKQAGTYAKIAKQIWQHAELGYQETQSSHLLQQTLTEAGFDMEEGVAEIPTAFVASYGSGKPVIGILAEFDALPGLSQDTMPQRAEIEGKKSGHACGHHLFGSASVAAAIAIKDWLKRSGTSGTLRLYGTPAEEGGAGKVYMVRDGLFDDVDAVLHWHPGDRNDASPGSSLSNKSAKFRFYGKSAHAAGAPERGRSALDAVEAMNYMVNLMREHVKQETRIHYVITRGGDAPNIVPEFAEVYYYIRHPDRAEVMSLFDRVVKAAEGAALGTGVRLEYEVIHGLYNLMPNEALSRVVYKNLQTVGGVSYDNRETTFANEIRTTLGTDILPLASSEQIQTFAIKSGGGSTDVGDISWVVPTAGMRAATWVPGVPAHSWQAVACGGMSIGMKGMMVAAKTLALSVYDLFSDPGAVIPKAKLELERRTGDEFEYEALLGDRKPPLDYRN
ncbi:MAG: amidohydrolase [Bacteroidota bacterium]